MNRLILVVLFLMSALSYAFSAEVDAATQALLADGNAALAQSDRDPSQNLVAALAFAKALPAYEAAGDSETVAELKSVIFWCKKRMDLGMLQRFVANKGDDGAMLTAAVAQVEQLVAASEAKDYLAKADAYAQKHSGQYLKIAIRYFEVADRFQGTPESLKAQRLSLDAVQQSMASRRAADPAMAAELRSAPIVAGDLPESARKLIAPSNEAVEEVVAKAAQAVAQDRRKATEVMLKEAESAQRKGDLDQMIAHQNQAKDMDRDLLGLSRTASAALEVYRKSRAKTVTKAANEVIAERKKLIQALAQAQKEETKEGNTSGALAIKNSIESLTQEVNEASAALVRGTNERPPALPPGSYKVSQTAWGVSSIVLDPKGNVRASNGDVGTWKLDRQGILTITWYNGNSNSGKMSSGPIVMNGMGGANFTLTREVEQKPLRERLVGAFKYDFKNGHAGTLSVQKNAASLAGFQGSVSQEKDTVVISWNNGTQWTITESSGEMIVSASDGTSKLIPFAAP